MNPIRLKLTIAYDGTGYAGWQRQQGQVGVQQRVEEALARLFPSAPRLHSASRTDTGVHALAMAAHVDIPAMEWRMTARKALLAINAHLPQDIRVQTVRRCASAFHARFHATGKEYRYFVWNHAAMNPLWRFQAWHVPGPLDERAMRAAARRFVGEHDFRSLAANRNYPVRNTVRRLWRCAIARQGALWSFAIRGDGFLYKMCRGIVGTLVQVGQGKIAPDEIAAILESRDRRVAGMTAPAQGLVLWKVLYGRRPAVNRSRPGPEGVA